jgi:integrase
MTTAVRPKFGRSLSHNSINETLRLLAQVLESAVEYEHIPFNPARGRRRRLKTTEPKRTWLAPEQIKPLLDATVRGLRGGKTTPDPRMHTLFATAICTGLRISELINLSWQTVNIPHNRLTVLNAKTAAGTGREIDLWPELTPILTNYKTTTKHPAPTDYVFATSTGNPDTRSNIARRLKRAINRANTTLTQQDQPTIPHELSPHSLRRTYPSLLYLRGENPSTSCTKWATPTPSSHSASTPKSQTSNATTDPASCS